jgi:hypothetical protein
MLREIPYRSYEHFQRKVADRIKAFNRQDLGRGGGEHVLKLEGATDEQLQEEWALLNSVPVVFDPIPSRSEARPKRLCAVCLGSGLTNTETGARATNDQAWRSDVDQCATCDGSGIEEGY